jgi:streptogrisin C
LGPAFAGAWVDAATGELVVGTTDARRAAAVRALGAVPRPVDRSAAALDAVQAALDGRASTVPASVAGWYVDVTTNSVVVEVVGGDPAGRAFAAVGGDSVRVVEVAEAPRPFWNIIGGQLIQGSGNRCSVGFNARSLAGVRYVITAGHCTNRSASWTGAGGTIGTVAGSSYPGNDYGVIRVTSPSAASTALVDRYSVGGDVSVAGSIPSLIGTSVCRSGSTTAYRCGTVTGYNGR